MAVRGSRNYFVWQNCGPSTSFGVFATLSLVLFTVYLLHELKMQIWCKNRNRSILYRPLGRGGAAEHLRLRTVRGLWALCAAVLRSGVRNVPTRMRLCCQGDVLEGGEGADDDEYEKEPPSPSAEDHDDGDSNHQEKTCEDITPH